MKYIDMHCDTMMKLWYAKLRDELWSLSDAPLMVNLDELEKGGCMVQNMALFVDLGLPVDFDGYEDGLQRGWSTRVMDPWYQLMEMNKVFHEEIVLNSDRIVQVRNVADIKKAQAQGKIGALLTVEDGGCCCGSFEHLEILYEEGVRMMTLTWNYENDLGFPNYPAPEKDMYFHFSPERMEEYAPDRNLKSARECMESGDTGRKFGLKKRGLEFVEAMEELGMIVDVSHLSDAGFYDVCDIARKPFVASHSNARTLCGCNRNMTDDMIRRVGEHGGVIGLNFCPDFVDPHVPSRQTAEAVARMARHMADCGGVDCVGIGTDFDGIGGSLETDRAGKMQILADALMKAGFSREETERIFWKNVFRVYEEALR